MILSRMVDILLAWIILTNEHINGSKMEDELQAKLFKNYNKHIRPSQNLDDIVEVHFFLTLLQLISVAEKSEEMTTSQYITFRWHDSRLSWIPNDYGGIQGIRLPSTIIWKPDVALSNNVDGEYDKTIPVNALLNYTGVVEWIPPAIYKSSCSIQVDYFPFDWQNCTLRFQSFTYSASEVNLVSEYDKAVVDSEAYTDNGEWNIIHCPIKMNRDINDKEYQDITLYLIIQRKPLFYIINIIVPCVLISSLSVLVFYLPSGCSEKTNMSISVLLGLPVYLLLLAKRVPETSLGVPLIGAYLLFTMLSVTFSVIFSVVVLNVYHRSPSTYIMQPWVRILFIEFLPPLLYMKTPVIQVPTPSSHPDGSFDEPRHSNPEQPEEKTANISNQEYETQRKTSLPSKIERETTESKKEERKILKNMLISANARRHRRIKNMHENRRKSNVAPEFSVDSGIGISLDPPGPLDTGTKQPCKANGSLPGNKSSHFRRTYQAPDTYDKRIYYAYEPNISNSTQKRRWKSLTCGIKLKDISEGKNVVAEKLDISSLTLSNPGIYSSIESRGSGGGANTSPVEPEASTSREYLKLSCDKKREVFKISKSSSGSTRSILSTACNSDPYFNMRPASNDSHKFYETTRDIRKTLELGNASDKRPEQNKIPPPFLEGNCFSMNATSSQSSARKRKVCVPSFDATQIKVETKFISLSPTTLEIPDSADGVKRKSDEVTIKHVIHNLPTKANDCLGAVNFICQHVRDEHNYKARVQEWRMVAMVLDRLMFWIFLLLYITGSLYFSLQAATNYPPNHPFLAGDPKYAKCWDVDNKQMIKSKFYWNG